MALATIKNLNEPKKLFVDDVIAILPESDAITTLASMGPIAMPAVEDLKKIADDPNSSERFAAQKAIWQITEKPELAIALVREILHDNRFQIEEIKTEQRQYIWEALRFLVENHGDNEEAKRLFQVIENCRFQNLRVFYANLQEWIR